jgi:hypothetical protein
MSAREWFVGMKLVFVGYPFRAGIFHGDKQIKRVEFLTVGHVYTILDIEIRDRFKTGKWAGPSIFVGCVDPECGRVWHHYSGFRPVETRQTDIKCFTQMLNPSKINVGEPA